MVVESGYNKEENTIDTQAYTSTILEQSADAGDSYVDETLFLGDSNTAPHVPHVRLLQLRQCHRLGGHDCQEPGGPLPACR